MLNRIRRTEEGSLVVAMGVLMILGLLTIAMAARSSSSLQDVRRNQDYKAALSSADGGLAEAMFEIDQGQNTNFTGDGELGEGEYEFQATKVDANTWKVKAKGTVNGVEHAIESTVYREVEYQYAIFTDQDLRINGNGAGNLTSYNSITGATNTGNAIIGSNNAIVINGGGGGDGQHFYTPNGSCSGCGNAVQKKGPKELDEPDPPSSFQACPAGGVFGSSGTINGAGGLAYKCSQNVTFASGNISITNGPVIIYVAPNFSVSMSGANINAGGKAKDFRLLKAGSGSFDVGNGSHVADVVGIIYGPSSSVTINGGQMTLDGSMTLNQLTVNGGPNFIARYDDSVSSIVAADWRALNWREISVNQY